MWRVYCSPLLLRQRTICTSFRTKLQSANIYHFSPNAAALEKKIFPQFLLQNVRLATKKAGGSSRNGRDSIGKRLGVKKLGGQRVSPGHIIIRQRGKTYYNGENTKLGRDYTVYSVAEGYVFFRWDRDRKKQIVSVTPHNMYLKPKEEPGPTMESIESVELIAPSK